MQVVQLFVKPRHGDAMSSVGTMNYDKTGLSGSVSCAPFRQVLIASQSATAECGLQPGDLRENIIVDCDDLYDLPSGTVVQIGTAMIRLTFHCEPCKQITRLIRFDEIVHRRGVFGTFLNSGAIAVGDEFTVTEQRYEAIPYAVKDRIQWFLKNQNVPGLTTDLVHKIGLPASYARFMSRFLQKRSDPATERPQAAEPRAELT
jgi:MOSC domain-containing protein YiiM